MVHYINFPIIIQSYFFGINPTLTFPIILLVSETTCYNNFVRFYNFSIFCNFCYERLELFVPCIFKLIDKTSGCGKTIYFHEKNYIGYTGLCVCLLRLVLVSYLFPWCFSISYKSLNLLAKLFVINFFKCLYIYSYVFHSKYFIPRRLMSSFPLSSTDHYYYFQINPVLCLFLVLEFILVLLF